MISTKKISAVILILMAAITGLPSTGVADVLRIGVEGAYKPFSWKEPDGTLRGFDIDMARAICTELGSECELVEQDWDGMIPALLANKFDAIIASMSITDERKRQVDFSDKYYQSAARFVAPEETALIPTAESLAGKRIGVQRGTTNQCHVEKHYPEAELVLYGTQDEVFIDLALGRLDMQLSTALVAHDSFLDTEAGKGFAFLGEYQIDQECFGEGIGIAVRKEDSELRAALNSAITELRADGTYTAINDLYFDFDIYGEE